MGAYTPVSPPLFSFFYKIPNVPQIQEVLIDSHYSFDMDAYTPVSTTSLFFDGIVLVLVCPRYMEVLIDVRTLTRIFRPSSPCK